MASEQVAVRVTLTPFCCPAGLEDRPGSGSWGTSDQNSSSFDPSRVRSLCEAQDLGYPLWGGGVYGKQAYGGKSEASLVSWGCGPRDVGSGPDSGTDGHACLLELISPAPLIAIRLHRPMVTARTSMSPTVASLHPHSWALDLEVSVCVPPSPPPMLPVVLWVWPACSGHLRFGGFFRSRGLGGCGLLPKKSWPLKEVVRAGQGPSEAGRESQDSGAWA